MCNPISGVVLKTKKAYISEKTDSHEGIVKEFGLCKKDGFVQKYAKVEYSPVRDSTLDLLTWEFELDEERKPDWWTDAHRVAFLFALEKMDKKNIYSRALPYCGKMNYADLAQMLIDAGADVDSKSRFGDTALVLAADFGHAEVAKVLIDAGANVEAADDNGDTVLILAAENNNTDLVKNLIAAGVNVNAKNRTGETALMGAAEKGRTQIVKMLLNAGADVNATDEFGDTALSKAERYEHAKIAKIIKKAKG